MPPKIDRTNQIFHDWLIVEDYGRMCKAVCVCGLEVIRAKGFITIGLSKRCRGCAATLFHQWSLLTKPKRRELNRNKKKMQDWRHEVISQKLSQRALDAAARVASGKPYDEEKYRLMREAAARARVPVVGKVSDE